ncbi:MAG: transglycosylase family protein [Solirubrobacterales bacterium]
MLKKHTYIAPVLLLALAVPASASGAAHADVAIGISAARPLRAALAPPLERFHHAIRVVNRRNRAQRRAELRRRRRLAFATLPGGVSLATLDAIAACESGGDPTAVSADGSYRGKYQFDYGTWESVGGSGDPAAASEAEQDYRAALLYSEAGPSPWPVCG